MACSQTDASREASASTLLNAIEDAVRGNEWTAARVLGEKVQLLLDGADIETLAASRQRIGRIIDEAVARRSALARRISRSNRRHSGLRKYGP